jgi:hypothetical protein
MLLRGRSAFALLRLYVCPRRHTQYEQKTHLPCTPSAIHCVQVMYSYYACSCVGIRWPKLGPWHPAWPLARTITTLQLTQMFANLALLVGTCYTCGPNNRVSFWLAAVMPVCFACLFMGLYRQRYTNDQKKQSREHAPAGCQHAKGLLRGASACWPPAVASVAWWLAMGRVRNMLCPASN